MTLHRDKPLYIAEISANHLGSLERALKLIEAAAEAGATAVKFQTYTADTMTLDLPEMSVSEGHELWGGRSLYSLYEEAHTPWDWHPELFERCRELDVIPFSSPFDSTAVDFLESLNAPMYKIASLETSDHALIRKVASTGKPVIISTGATEWDEVASLVEVFKDSGNTDLTLLVCTSSYPADPADAHIARMKTLRDTFHVKVGLSDHTLGTGVSIAAIALGATAIEKHITIKRSDGGADSAFSMEPHEFMELVIQGNFAFQSLGSAKWAINDSEKESRRLRRSLYVVKDVSAGELATLENVRAIRPGYGASPSILSTVLGKKFAKDCNKGTPFDLSLVEN
jgi:N-acetylneuraminate synthase